MKIISPTYQKGHTYSEYREKIQEIKIAFAGEDYVCLDIDFLHENELDHYFKDIVIAFIVKEFKIRSKYMKRIKEVLKVLSRYMIITSDLSYGDGFYYVTIYS